MKTIIRNISFLISSLFIFTASGHCQTFSPGSFTPFPEVSFRSVARAANPVVASIVGRVGEGLCHAAIYGGSFHTSLQEHLSSFVPEGWLPDALSKAWMGFFWGRSTIKIFESASFGPGALVAMFGCEIARHTLPWAARWGAEKIASQLTPEQREWAAPWIQSTAHLTTALVPPTHVDTQRAEIVQPGGDREIYTAVGQVSVGAHESVFTPHLDHCSGNPLSTCETDRYRLRISKNAIAFEDKERHTWDLLQFPRLRVLVPSQAQGLNSPPSSGPVGEEFSSLFSEKQLLFLMC